MGKDNDTTQARTIGAERIQQLVAGLTYKASTRKPQQIQLPGENDGNKVALNCHNLFSEEECAALIELTKTLGYKKGSQSKGIPKATNVTLNSHTISQLFWERLETFVPTELRGKRVLGVEEKIRFIKYEPLTSAAGVKKEAPLNWLAIGKYPMSVIVFLNDNYEGGMVIFPDSANLTPPTHHTTCPAGQVLILEDNVKSNMLQVTKGTKYVMRLDIITEAEIGMSNDDLLGAERQEMVDTIHKVSLSEINQLPFFSPLLPPNMPSLPTMVTDFQLDRSVSRVLLLDEVPVPGPAHTRTDALLGHSISLTRSDCSHDPYVSKCEMNRGSFIQDMDPSCDDTPEIDESMERQYSGRVAMDEPGLAAFPSLRSLVGNDGGLQSPTPHAFKKRRTMPKGSRSMLFSEAGTNYPSLISDDLLQGE